MSCSVRRGLVMSRSIIASYCLPVRVSMRAKLSLGLDLRHAVPAQLGPAEQVDDLQVLGGHQLGQVTAVGVRNVDFQLRVLLMNSSAALSE